jgi:hypothetical protein
MKLPTANTEDTPAPTDASPTEHQLSLEPIPPPAP